MLCRTTRLLRGAAAAAACGGLFVAQQQPTESLFSRDSKKTPKREVIHGYTIHHMLGEGAYAVVKLVTDRLGTDRALKIIDKEKSDAEALQRELRVLQEVGRHRHIVSLIDHFEMPEAWALVLELVTGGEVFDSVVENGAYSEKDAATVVREVALALQHLHGRGIVHRDLKPENLLQF